MEDPDFLGNFFVRGKFSQVCKGNVFWDEAGVFAGFSNSI